jgi:hypothetical protein
MEDKKGGGGAFKASDTPREYSLMPIHGLGCESLHEQLPSRVMMKMKEAETK